MTDTSSGITRPMFRVGLCPNGGFALVVNTPLKDFAP